MLSRGLFAFAALLLASPACAQFSGSVSVLSDYRYRGISLSDGRPVGQVSLTYDSAYGGYAGLLLSGIRHARDDDDDSLLLPYLGYARRLESGLTWDIGAQYSRFTSAIGYRYLELYAGLASDRFAGRIYYSPDYFGRGRVAYAEINITHPLPWRMHLVGHAGILLLDGGGTLYDSVDAPHCDVRAGLGMTLQAFEMELTWNAVGDGVTYLPYPARDSGDRSAWLLRLTHGW